MLGAARSRIPEPAKAALRPAREVFRRATSAGRTLPDFIVIGGQRCGTTAFHHHLTRHPAVIRAADKEIHFFDLQWRRGVEWYRGRFPLRARIAFAGRRNGVRPITGDATPYYLFHPHVPARAAATVPDAKLIALLRDPVDRAYSHYQWMRKHGEESLSFAEALEHEPERLAPEIARMAGDEAYDSPAHRNFSYLARGRYAEQLRSWLTFFPEARLLVIASEDYFARPAETLAEAFEFLGVPPEPVPISSQRIFAQTYEAEMSAEDRAYLVEYFRQPNADLYELLGRDLGWSR